MGTPKLINKTDTASNLASANPVLADGELGYASDTKILKMGDGATAWNDLEGAKLAINEVPLGAIIGIPKPICYPVHLQFLCRYEVDGIFDATWSTFGNLYGAGVNNPDVAGGRLDLVGGTPPNPGKYVDYIGEFNLPTLTQQGCVRFLYNPNYSGTPNEDIKFFAIAGSTVGNTNLITLGCDADGTLRLTMYDSTGTLICDEELGYWDLMESGINYEFEVNWDLDLGEIRVFLDGTQFGATIEETGTRTNSNYLIRVGNGPNPENYSSMAQIDDFMIFDQVIHTGDYERFEDVLTLPTQLQGKYVPCTGVYIDNEVSPYNGKVTPDMSSIDPNILWAWKIVD
jgi:hypothetical protein